MHVVIRRMSSLGGLVVAADEPLETDRVTLGRGTDQDVQLPDMRVTLAHAEIRREPDGGYRVECMGDSPVWVNGSPMPVATLGTGDTLDLGRFRLTIAEPSPGEDLVLEVMEHLSAREDKGRRRAEYRLTLAQAGLGKRRWAWALGALALLGLLLVPLTLRYAGGEGRSLDALWQSGPSSAAHSAFIGDCSACHQTPFARVRNDACLACHKQQPHHSDHAELLAAEGMSGARCASCHREHSGRQALIARSPELCTNCHANPGAHFAAAQLPPVHGFDEDHPAFTLSLPLDRLGPGGKTQRVEVAQAEGARLTEHSGLLFPHDKHLAAHGVKSFDRDASRRGGPEGNRVMSCGDCHVPVGSGFAPVRMADHCASCHTLDFDPDFPGRSLPHGEPAQVVAVIRDHYAGVALAGGVKEPAAPEVVRLIRRPGEALTREQSRAALAWADAQAARTIDDVFTRRVCAECHTVTPTADPALPYAIAPVMLTSKYLLGARFDHVAHRTEDCGRCHEAKDSKLASDVMIPPLANCRSCHSDTGASGQVASTCVDCHGFHTATKTTFAGLAAEIAK